MAPIPNHSLNATPNPNGEPDPCPQIPPALSLDDTRPQVYGPVASGPPVPHRIRHILRSCSTPNPITYVYMNLCRAPRRTPTSCAPGEAPAVVTAPIPRSTGTNWRGGSNSCRTSRSQRNWGVGTSTKPCVAPGTRSLGRRLCVRPRFRVGLPGPNPNPTGRRRLDGRGGRGIGRQPRNSGPNSGRGHRRRSATSASGCDISMRWCGTNAAAPGRGGYDLPRPGGLERESRTGTCCVTVQPYLGMRRPPPLIVGLHI